MFRSTARLIGRDAYFSTALVTIWGIETLEALAQWWREEAPNMRMHGLVEGTPGYAQIVAAGRARKAVLMRARPDRRSPSGLTEPRSVSAQTERSRISRATRAGA
jgi:hypothetical protein